MEIKTVTIKSTTYELWLDERLNMWRMIECKLLVDNCAVDLEIDMANLGGVVNWTEIAWFIEFIAYHRQIVNENIKAAQLALWALFKAIYREAYDEGFYHDIVFYITGIDYKGQCKIENQKNCLEYDFFFVPQYVKEPYKDIGAWTWRASFRDWQFLGVCRDA